MSMYLSNGELQPTGDEPVEFIDAPEAGDGAPPATRAPTEVVAEMFAAYLARDAETAAALLADDFRFTSPQDDHIDKAAFLDVCFPTASRLASQEILDLVSSGGDGVFVRYEYELRSGERHSNVEYIRVADGRLVETQVFFGAPL